MLKLTYTFAKYVLEKPTAFPCCNSLVIFVKKAQNLFNL